MNDKVDFLNFFVDAGNNPEESTLAGRVAEFFPAVVFTFDTKAGRISYVNKRFRDIFDHSVETQTPNPLRHIVHADDLPLLAAVFQRIAAGARECSASLIRFRDKSNSARLFNLSALVLENADDRGEILFVANDISEDIRARDEVRAHNRLFEHSEETMLSGAWSWDASTGELHCTDGIYRVLGYEYWEKPAAFTLDFYIRHVLPEYINTLREKVDLAHSGAAGFSYEYVIRTRNGEQRNVSTTAKIVCYPDGSVRQVLAVTHDITALKNHESEQEKSIEALSRTNRELEEFAYIASHDLQEPLRKIAMYSERLSSRCGDALDKESRVFLERILASAANMKTLIDNLLDFSRADSGAVPCESTDLAKVVEGVLTSLELKIEEAKAVVSVRDLPVIRAVPSEMHQLFTNLISNAIKFRKAGIPPEVSVSAYVLPEKEAKQLSLPSGGRYFRIDVRDNGIGFEEQFAEKIFQIFQRLHAKSEYSGTGIGLAICKRIVTNHRGLIRAQSTPGEGSTFTVILPEKQS